MLKRLLFLNNIFIFNLNKTTNKFFTNYTITIYFKHKFMFSILFQTQNTCYVFAFA